MYDKLRYIMLYFNKNMYLYILNDTRKSWFYPIIRKKILLQFD